MSFGEKVKKTVSDPSIMTIFIILIILYWLFKIEITHFFQKAGKKTYNYGRRIIHPIIKPRPF